YTRVFQRIESQVAAAEPAKGKGAKKQVKGKGRKAAIDVEAQSSVVLEMIQDRFRFDNTDRERVIEALESALRVGRDRVAVHVLEASSGARTADNENTPPAT